MRGSMLWLYISVVDRWGAMLGNSLITGEFEEVDGGMLLMLRRVDLIAAKGKWEIG